MISVFKRAGNELKRAMVTRTNSDLSSYTLPLPVQPEHSSLHPVTDGSEPTTVLHTAMTHGTMFVKLSEKKGAARETMVQVDMSQLRILWTSRTKSEPFMDIETIKELRTGDEVTALVRNTTFNTPECRECALAIVYTADGQRHILTLIAADKETFQHWLDGMRQLFNKYRTVGSLWALNRHATLLKRYWFMFDRQHSNRLDFDALLKLCTFMNLPYSKKELLDRFRKQDTENKSWLDFGAFGTVLHGLDDREDLRGIFAALAKEDMRGMNYTEFIDFVKVIQKNDLNDEEICKLFGKYTKGENRLNFAGFRAFLHSYEDSPPTAPAHREICQDMTKPLVHYFIDSSHNTYLLGNQLTGESSVEAYIRVLQMGCRCVEIDCWDGPNGQPVITHGFTLTTKILLRDVILAIKKHAFLSSPYPLILSFENHCSLEQQDAMAKILRDVLGDALVRTPLGENEIAVPSPEALKGKILVKCKVLKESKGLETATSIPHVPNSTVIGKLTEGSRSETAATDSSAEDEKMNDEKAPKAKIAKSFSDLAVYCKATKFLNLQESWKTGSFDCISSIAENPSIELIESELEDYIKLNTRQFTRVYPSGTRVQSTNLNPAVHWAAGSQIVALNLQTYDRGTQISRAMFASNGGCGYVIKPQHLRDVAIPKPVTKQLLTVQIISAQQLPKKSDSLDGDIIDPYCEVELTVGGDPRSPIKHKTKSVHDNGFNPSWNETFQFELTSSSLVFLRFSVSDQDLKIFDVIATCCVPLDVLLPGYRHLPLFDWKGELLATSTIFIRTQIKDV